MLKVTARKNVLIKGKIKIYKYESCFCLIILILLLETNKTRIETNAYSFQ